MLQARSIEPDLFYEMTDKLAHANTIADLLSGVVPFFEAHQVSSASLCFIDNDESGQPEWIQVVAAWQPAKHRADLVYSQRYHVSDYLSSALVLSSPDVPSLVPDIEQSDRFDEVSRAAYRSFGFRATANLPVHLAGRWVGLISLNWADAHDFTPAEIQLYTVTSRQLGWRVDAMRALAEVQKQREQAELLAKVTSALSQATDEQSIINTVALLATRYGARSTSLLYSVLDDNKQPIGGDIVALCDENGRPVALQNTPKVHFRNHEYPLIDLVYGHPNEILFIEDGLHDPLIDDRTRAFIQATQFTALIVIPLQLGQEWLGLVALAWTDTTVFDREARRLFNSVHPSLVTTVSNRRLYLAEQAARSESAQLARLGEAINATATYQEILEAVAQNSTLHVYQTLLTLYQGYDIETAAYGDVVAMVGPSIRGSRQRIERRYFDVSRSHDLRTVSDTTDRNQIDETAAFGLSVIGAKAFIGAPIVLNDRIMGNLSFLSDVPRNYAEQDRRMMAGIANLVAGALERSRLNAEVEAARKQLELLYQSSEERLRLIINYVPLILYVLDKNGTIVLSEGKALSVLGLKPGQLIGQSAFEVYRASPDALRFLKGAFDGQTSEATIQIGSLYFQSWYTPLRGDNGQIDGVIGVSIDVTDRRLAEIGREALYKSEQAARREAQEAVRFKDLFLATMSHELRTPLNAMIGYQSLMLIGSDLNDDNRHMVERSLANSQRLLGLINNILDISRMASGGLQIVPVSVDIRQLAQNIAEDLKLQVQLKNLAFTVTVKPTVPALVVQDPERLTQIVLNLAGNALKFTEQGEVAVRFAAEADRLILEVRDTGIGMPPSRQHVIFDEFVQLDNTSTRKHQGAGLGLSIVKRLLLLMKGTITVKSEVGQGSIFTVTLPLNLEPSAQMTGGGNVVTNS